MADDFLNQQEQPQAQEANAVDQLVGEGKKFKDVNALAEGKIEADRYVETVKAERDELKASIEEMRNQIKSLDKDALLAEVRRELSTATQPTNQAGADQPSKEDRDSGVKVDDIQALVRQALDEDDKQKQVERNQATAREYMLNKYGTLEKSTEVLSSLARELEVPVEYLYSQANVAPKALFKLLEESQTAKREGTGAPMAGNVNTAALNATVTNTSVKPNTQAWYDAKRREMGDRAYYADTSLQQSKMRDAETNPNFFG